MHLLLAPLLLAAMPAVAPWATPPWRITFEPAPGPVEYYQARVRTLTAEAYYLSLDATPEVGLAALPLDDYWIDARVWAGGSCGHWSLPHRVTQDLNKDGIVNSADFILLLEDFDMRKFIEMSRHWRDRTEINGIGVRDYVEEAGE